MVHESFSTPQVFSSSVSGGERTQIAKSRCLLLSFSSCSANIYHYSSPFKVSFVVKRDKAQSRGKVGTKLVIVYAFLSSLTMQNFNEGMLQGFCSETSSLILSVIQKASLSNDFIILNYHGRVLFTFSFSSLLQYILPEI